MAKKIQYPAGWTTKDNFQDQPNVDPSEKVNATTEWNPAFIDIQSTVDDNFERLVLSWTNDITDNTVLIAGQYVDFTDNVIYRIDTGYDVGTPKTWNAGNATAKGASGAPDPNKADQGVLLGAVTESNITMIANGTFTEYTPSGNFEPVLTSQTEGNWINVPLVLDGIKKIVKPASSVIINQSFEDGALGGSLAPAAGNYSFVAMVLGGELQVLLYSKDFQKTSPLGLLFDEPSEQYAQNTTPTGVIFGNGVTDLPFSVTFNARWTDIIAFQRVFQIAFNGGSLEYWVTVQMRESGKIRFAIYDDNANNLDYIDQDTALNWGQLYKIACTYSGTGGNAGLKIYIDGSIVATSQFTFGTYVAMHASTGNEQVHVGGVGPVGNEKTMDGGANDVALWDVELSAGDVTELYAAGDFEYDVTTHSKYAADAVSLWKLRSDLLDSKAVNSLTGINSPVHGNI